MSKLAQLEALRRPVKLDLANKAPKVQEIGLAFARRIESGNLTEQDLDRLIKLLGNEEDEKCP